jgi:hypothetical protein
LLDRVEADPPHATATSSGSTTGREIDTLAVACRSCPGGSIPSITKRESLADSTIARPVGLANIAGSRHAGASTAICGYQSAGLDLDSWRFEEQPTA